MSVSKDRLLWFEADFSNAALLYLHFVVVEDFLLKGALSRRSLQLPPARQISVVTSGDVVIRYETLKVQNSSPYLSS